MVNHGQYHKIVVDGVEYVHKESFIEQFEDGIKQHRDDWEKDSEAQSAFDVAVRVINQL